MVPERRAVLETCKVLSDKQTDFGSNRSRIFHAYNSELSLSEFQAQVTDNNAAFWSRSIKKRRPYMAIIAAMNG